jgi:hypothetical protein
VVIEALLRRATTRLAGGHYGDAAVALLGLDAGTRGLNPKARCEIAAQAFERTYETFRKNYEPLVFEQLATQILILCSEQQTRETRSGIERATSREETAMSHVWIDRFAAYYRIWSPVNGLGADLTAYRSTLLESDKVWDRRFGTDAPDDPGYSTRTSRPKATPASRSTTTPTSNGNCVSSRPCSGANGCSPTPTPSKLSRTRCIASSGAPPGTNATKATYVRSSPRRQTGSCTDSCKCSEPPISAEQLNRSGLNGRIPAAALGEQARRFRDVPALSVSRDTATGPIPWSAALASDGQGRLDGEVRQEVDSEGAAHSTPYKVLRSRYEEVERSG